MTSGARAAILLIAATGAAASAFAQDTGTIAPDVAAALAEGEPVSVIIALWPEGGIRRDSVYAATTPAEVARVQDAVLANLSSGEFQVSVRYSHILALSGRLYAAGVEKLASDPHVRRVDLDIGGGGNDDRK